MKDKIQKISKSEILEIERIFVASFHNANVLFTKPKTVKAAALKLPKMFLQELIVKIEAKI